MVVRGRLPRCAGVGRGPCRSVPRRVRREHVRRSRLAMSRAYRAPDIPRTAINRSGTAGGDAVRPGRSVAIASSARGRCDRHRMEPVVARWRSRFSDDRRARPYAQDQVVDAGVARSGACKANRGCISGTSRLVLGAVLADPCAWLLPLPLREGRHGRGGRTFAGAWQWREPERPARRCALSCAGAFRAGASRSRARCSHGTSARQR